MLRCKKLSPLVFLISDILLMGGVLVTRGGLDFFLGMGSWLDAMGKDQAQSPKLGKSRYLSTGIVPVSCES